MRKIIDVKTEASEGQPIDDREWWKRGSRRAFADLIEAMDIKALERLRAEMSGAAAVIQSQLETREADTEWYPRARRAVAYISQRNAMVKAVINTHNDRHRLANEGRKASFVADARTRLKGGDVTGAVSVVLDLLEGAHARGK